VAARKVEADSLAELKQVVTNNNNLIKNILRGRDAVGGGGAALENPYRGAELVDADPAAADLATGVS